MTDITLPRAVVEQALKALDASPALNLGRIKDELRERLAQPEHSCVACEGRPTGDNDPCAVCGLAQPEKEPEKTTDADRLDWLQKAANARKVELARSIYKTGYEIGEWPSMRVTVKYGSLRQAIDEAMQRETNT
jgi:hypothetical protein